MDFKQTIKHVKGFLDNHAVDGVKPKSVKGNSRHGGKVHSFEFGSGHQTRYGEAYDSARSGRLYNSLRNHGFVKNTSSKISGGYGVVHHETGVGVYAGPHGRVHIHDGGQHLTEKMRNTLNVRAGKAAHKKTDEGKQIQRKKAEHTRKQTHLHKMDVLHADLHQTLTKHGFKRNHVGEYHHPHGGMTVALWKHNHDETASTRKQKAIPLTAYVEETAGSGLKLVKTHEGNGRTAKVYKDQEWGEHRVKLFDSGKHLPDADYHTDDLEDAHDAAKHWIKTGK